MADWQRVEQRFERLGINCSAVQELARVLWAERAAKPGLQSIH